MRSGEYVKLLNWFKLYFLDINYIFGLNLVINGKKLILLDYGEYKLELVCYKIILDYF